MSLNLPHKRMAKKEKMRDKKKQEKLESFDM